MGARLKSCAAGAEPRTAAAADQAAADPQMAELQSRWDELKPRISARGLTENPDLVEAAMDLVFTIERATGEHQNDRQGNEAQHGANCAAPTEKDQALLLIAKMHGGN